MKEFDLNEYHEQLPETVLQRLESLAPDESIRLFITFETEEKKDPKELHALIKDIETLTIEEDFSFIGGLVVKIAKKDLPSTLSQLKEKGIARIDDPEAEDFHILPVKEKQ